MRAVFASMRASLLSLLRSLAQLGDEYLMSHNSSDTSAYIAEISRVFFTA